MSEQQTTSLTVRLPGEMAEALRTYAFVTGTSVNEAIKRAVSAHLQQNARPDLIEAAFERTLKEHKGALDKLAEL